MATPAAVLSILVTANTAQATTALATTQGQLKATAATAASTSSVIKSRLATGAKYGALAMAGLGAASVKMPLRNQRRRQCPEAIDRRTVR